MNTIPDDTRLALWLDDELTGSELAEMDAWAATQPGQLQAREEFRSYRRMMAENIPASEEPPYPDFFLSRVNQGIRDLDSSARELAATAPVRKSAFFWKSWFIPTAACAGMIFAFEIGRQSRPANQPLTVVPPLTPVVYTPEEGVDAKWFASKQADATVIVLKGVAAIPDSTDFFETVYVPTSSEADRTATHEKTKINATKQ
ncbi:MAG: hypothetical protein H7Y36_06905 [Armatimonadetes bacterium]|nr:hypothetical protein [Akkermansiaceae bacterium]